MNARTLKALKASIAHWKRHAEGKARANEGPNGRDCALCALFSSPSCTGCPVRAATHLPQCKGTPWRDAAILFGSPGQKQSQAFRENAKTEYDFLRSLLPKRKPKRKRT